MKHIRLFSILLILSLSQLFSQTIVVKGIVVDGESQTPLVGVNIVSGKTGTITDDRGVFDLSIKNADEIIFSFIGYKTITTTPKDQMTIFMVPTILEGAEVMVEATRAVAGITPVSFSNLTAKEIETFYGGRCTYDSRFRARCLGL